MEGNLLVKIWKPSKKEYGEPKKLLKTILNDPAFQQSGLAKIVPPVESRHTPNHLTDDLELDNCIKIPTSVIDKTKIIMLDFGGQPEKMTLGQFKTLASRVDNLGCDDMWEIATKPDLWNKIQPIYAIDNSWSRFPDSYDIGLNLKKFQSILTSLDVCLEGINTPFVNFGMKGTYFGMHIEDSNACSVNTLHEGKPKTWYGLPTTMAKKLENISKSEIKKYTGCDLFIRHKSLLYPPEVLRDNGIDFAKIDQYEGEIIMTHYNAYHQGFNNGYNCSEAINFAFDDWQKFYDETTLCSCRYGKEALQRHEEMGEFLKQHSNQLNGGHWPKFILKVSRSRCFLWEECGSLTNVFCEECDNYFCFTSKNNCFKKFHETQFRKLDGHWPTYEPSTSSRARCAFNCNIPSSLTHVKCSKCQEFLCLSHQRNCFVSHHFPK